MTHQMTSGTGLLEKTAEAGASAPVRRGPRFWGPRYFWLLLAVIVAAVALLAAWTVLQTREAEQSVEESLGVLSDHDSGIAMRLRDRGRQVPVEHDAGIAGAVRERRGAQTGHDSGIAGAVRERGGTQTSHDSGIAAAVRERAGSGPDGTNCAPATPGQGGWEARLSLGC